MPEPRNIYEFLTSLISRNKYNSHKAYFLEWLKEDISQYTTYKNITEEDIFECALKYPNEFDVYVTPWGYYGDSASYIVCKHGLNTTQIFNELGFKDLYLEDPDGNVSVSEFMYRLFRVDEEGDVSEYSMAKEYGFPHYMIINNVEYSYKLDENAREVKVYKTIYGKELLADQLDDVIKSNPIPSTRDDYYVQSWNKVRQILVTNFTLSDEESEDIMINYYKKPIPKDLEVLDTSKKLTEDKNNLVNEDIEKHDALNPILFDGEELKPEVKTTIENIVTLFIDELQDDEIQFNLKDVILLGSNVSYNYTKDSDLDVHLIADSKNLKCPDDLYPLLYGAYVNIFNKNYDITIKDIPVELYVEIDETTANSNGIYSLTRGWIKKPVQQDIPDIDINEFEKEFKDWEDKYFNLLNTEVETNEDKSESITNFINDLYDLRKQSISKDGEYSLGNLIFKEFRNMGYLNNLKDLRKIEKSKELSLENLNR